tara:strand:+ start:1604 stop:1750 length:147 start_codon:yes stop_codon:yes gene_type:complete
LADKIGEMMDHLLTKQKEVSKDKMKISKQSSDVDFTKIMNELQDEKKK